MTTTTLSPVRLDAFRRYRQAANYLAAAQIYLKDNCLLEQPLQRDHLKPRLLGHWGTCPGINLVYAGLNRLVLDTDRSVLLVTGPGHGAPANLANLWLEGSLADHDPALTVDRQGLDRLVRNFSWPGGYPSHLAPMVPGVIHEGGELGYALATAYGAALDNPELLVACIVGDGEAETGPTATAWHCNKFLDPATGGAVLPILHLNGYKIASPTIMGTMSQTELTRLFEGYGWRPRFVTADDQSEDPDAELATALDHAHAEIRELQRAARRGRHPERPAWPMLVLRSPKGWTGVEQLDGEQIEGTFRSHQVPIPDPHGNPEHLAALERWLRSYRPETLFDTDGHPTAEVLACVPAGQRRMGANPNANGGRVRVPLDLPSLEDHQVRLPEPGEVTASPMQVAGGYLREVLRRSQPRRNFRIVCPDELTSNKLDATLEATGRAYQWPTGPQDVGMATDGRIMEVLSEHDCQAWLQGYLLTGRHGVFPCYEAFASIVDSMVNQYAKFLKMAGEVPWRAPVAALNYLLTSEGWRQEHNGYSHQGPGFINNLLTKKASVTRIYLPPDANTLLVTLEHCLASTGYINLVVSPKQPLAQWTTLEQARTLCRAGAGAWPWAGTGPDTGEPDVVLAAAGAIPTVEVLAAAALLRRDAPGLRTRVVNVCDLLSLQHPRDHPHGLAPDEFASLFPTGAPVVLFFHGYPSAVHELLHHRPDPARFHVKGYIEEGTTTTPFDLLVANKASRYHIAMEALRRASGWSTVAGELVERYQAALTAHHRYIRDHGQDPPEIEDWTWATATAPDQQGGRA